MDRPPVTTSTLRAETTFATHDFKNNRPLRFSSAKARASFEKKYQFFFIWAQKNSWRSFLRELPPNPRSPKEPENKTLFNFRKKNLGVRIP